MVEYHREQELTHIYRRSVSVIIFSKAEIRRLDQTLRRRLDRLNRRIDNLECTPYRVRNLFALQCETN